MPIILSIFDNKIGPVNLITIPEYFDKSIQDKNIKTFDIISDSDDEIFFKDFSDMGMLSLNLQFKISSSWARGGSEMIQLCAIISNKSPPIQLITSILRSYRDKLKNEPNLFKAFYGRINNYDGVDYSEDKDVIEHYKKLKGFMVEFNESINLYMPATNSYIISMNDLINLNHINIPLQSSIILNDIMKDNESKSDKIKKDCFFVCFKKDPVKGEISINIIPSDKKIMRIMIISSHFIPKVFIELNDLINLPIVYTRGICQESKDRCTYETYFNFTGDFITLKEYLSSKFKERSFIKDFQIECVEFVETTR